MKALSLIAGTLLSAQAIAGPAIDKEFASMDSDHDGKVSAAEHAAGAKMMFEKMDANQAAKNSDMPAADKIKAVDANGDGVLTAEEHSKASASMFAKMDADKDGFLSRQEMAAGHAAMMKKQ
jgi:Ca2+-binding EF-hand superfamily protein